MAVQQQEAEFIAGQARLLAESLEHGSPCPVCGSVDHPEPAHGGEPSAGLETAWRQAQALLDGAAEEAQSAESAWSSALGIRDERKKALDGLEAPDTSATDPATAQAAMHSSWDLEVTPTWTLLYSI